MELAVRHPLGGISVVRLKGLWLAANMRFFIHDSKHDNTGRFGESLLFEWVEPRSSPKGIDPVVLVQRLVLITDDNAHLIDGL